MNMPFIGFCLKWDAIDLSSLFLALSLVPIFLYDCPYLSFFIQCKCRSELPWEICMYTRTYKLSLSYSPSGSSFPVPFKHCGISWLLKMMWKKNPLHHIFIVFTKYCLLHMLLIPRWSVPQQFHWRHLNLRWKIMGLKESVNHSERLGRSLWLEFICRQGKGCLFCGHGDHRQNNGILLEAKCKTGLGCLECILIMRGVVFTSTVVSVNK